MIAILENEVNVIHENLKPENFDRFRTELVLLINHITMDQNNSFHIEAINHSFTFFRVQVNDKNKTVHMINVNDDLPQIDENRPLFTIPYTN